jgi:hypothetical protein
VIDTVLMQCADRFNKVFEQLMKLIKTPHFLSFSALFDDGREAARDGLQDDNVGVEVNDFLFC